MTRPGSELSSADVAEWKHSVRSFFQDEWSQLRQLVLEMEEQTWERAASSPASDADQLAGLSNVTSEESSLSAGPADAESTSEQNTDDRLAQLAQSIELRMQNNNCGEF